MGSAQNFSDWPSDVITLLGCCVLLLTFVMYSFRSYVHLYKPLHPVKLPSKDEKSFINLDTLVDQNIPGLKDNSWFWISPLLGNGDLQTMYAAAGNFESVDEIYYGRRLVRWDDGATVSVDYVLDPPASSTEWAEALKYKPIENLPPFPSRTRYLTPEEILRLDDPQETRPLVISLHGLTGGSHESYVRATISKLIGEDRHFDCAVLTSRGCNRTKITTPQLFCGAMTHDIRLLVKKVKATQPNRKLYLVGYSLGASILANYLGQEGEDIQVDGACCVANPWDLSVSGYGLHNTWMGRRVYSPAMTKNLLRLIKNHKDVLEEHPIFVKAQKKPTPKLIYEFDDIYTAPFFGFDSAHDYYRLASSIHRLTAVRTPTLILNSLDDPVVSGQGIPYSEVKNNPYTIMATTDVGGHLGWFQPGGNRWFPSVVAEFFRALDRNIDDFRNAEAVLDLPKRKWNVDKLVL
jgi:predicted alpha/beta-fold hydrolase